jgi:hypothetical protein
LIVARHSKHIPMPQSGPRGSPWTDRRTEAMPDAMMAVSALIEGATSTGFPFTFIAIVSGMNFFQDA